jgi:DNA gyrase subunit A
LFFTDKGRVFALKAYEIPEASRVAKGQAIVNLLDLTQDEKVLSVLPINKKNNMDGFIIKATQKGTIKKTAIKSYESIRRSGIIAIKLEKGDQLRWAKLSTGKDDVFLISQKGLSIRFAEKDIRPTARDTMGVRGIKLKGEDEVIGMDILNEETAKADLLVVASKGLGKKTAISEWHRQNRGGMGVKAANLTDRTGHLVTGQILTKSDESLVLTSIKGQVIRLPLRNVPRLGRDTQGVTLMRFSDTSDVVAASAIITKEADEPQVEKAPATEKDAKPRATTKTK